MDSSALACVKGKAVTEEMLKHVFLRGRLLGGYTALTDDNLQRASGISQEILI